jgi:hypothetical protein
LRLEDLKPAREDFRLRRGLVHQNRASSARIKEEQEMSDEPNRPEEDEVEAHGPLGEGPSNEGPFTEGPTMDRTDDEEPDVEAHGPLTETVAGPTVEGPTVE